ncbi:MAG: hypothetical protein IKO06_06585 [Alphaproteobacteria bacterium]|nr:hypothetical protein [Alphaproteobacteria bacterium]
MLKKILHFVCVFVVGIIWSFLLGALLLQILKIGFRMDFLSVKTYRGIAAFWNSGGVFKGKELLIFVIIFLYFPICVFGWHKINSYRFLRLITVPINWYLNRGLENYHAPDVNIKNLKLEEKKSLDQVVNERLEIEKKKQQSMMAGDLRKEIVKKLEKK